MHGFTSILREKLAIYVTSSLVTTFPALNGAHANVVLSGRQYLIQSNWLNSGGGSCAMGFNSQTPSGLTFVPVTPCRVADTRNPAGAFGGPFIAAQGTREFDIPNSACNIPATAQAYSVNATVVPHGVLGFLTAFPCGQPLPLASTLNAVDGRVKAARSHCACWNKWWYCVSLPPMTQTWFSTSMVTLCRTPDAHSLWPSSR